VFDVSQIHHTPEHSDAAIKALFETGRRAAFGYFESAGNFGAGVPGNQYPTDATRIKNRYFSSSDQLVHMIMGGEVYLGLTAPTCPGRSGGISVSRLRRISFRRSASVRSSTHSPLERAATAALESGRTTCSST
jgi:hypothetical protein